jgi:hypothetical protein
MEALRESGRSGGRRGCVRCSSLSGVAGLGYVLARDELPLLGPPCRQSLVQPCSSSLGILCADELTHLISFSRLALFTTCRKLIDKSLYNELKQISQLPSDEVPIELDTLPTPSATPTSGRKSTNDTSHSLLSKSLFSLCFSESCTLFLLLMCQALDALDAR